MTNVAVVLMNLGAPDSMDAVVPFLKNLFSDPKILRYPAVIRKPLAHLLAYKRKAAAEENYRILGGKSPLLENTQAQADALENYLSLERPDIHWKTFVCMRYWHPFADEVVQSVKKLNPEKTILLPLYPQYSTTTTGSSFDDWDRASAQYMLKSKTRRTCCYPRMSGLVHELVDQMKLVLPEMDLENTTVLFSAHGLPESIVNAGDPYVWQVQQTVQAILHVWGENRPFEWKLCFQSRVGPVSWVKPYLDAEVKQAAQRGRDILVIPVSFVSEHSETLVELDHEVRELALSQGAASYKRLQTVGTSVGFVEGLAQRVLTMLDKDRKLLSPTPECPKDQCQCYSLKFKTF